MLDTVKQEKAKVLFPSIRNLQVLPPVINLINCLSNDLAQVTVISYDLNRDSYHDEVELIQISNQKYPSRFSKRVKAKLSAWLFMLKYLYRNAATFNYIWIGVWDYPHLDFFARFFGFKGKIIFHFHELEFEKLKYCKKADFCVVPEENRLWLTYFLGKLERKPFLLPNIPYLPYIEFDSAPLALNSLKTTGKKIILYQGLIDFEKRCLSELIEAISFLPDFIVLVIMPMPSTAESVLESLKNRITELNLLSRVIVIEPQLPPYHLHYIKYADVGIGLYRPTTLNQIYAAPNRLYEFTKFGVPVILPDFPSFKALSSIYKYGIITVNPESSIGIANMIEDFFEKDNASKGRMQAEIFFNENANYSLKVEKLWSEITK